MRNISFRQILILGLVVGVILSCQDTGVDTYIELPSEDTVKIFKKEVPIYQNGLLRGDTSISFEEIRKQAADLGLEVIENGYDKLQIRVWLGHSMAVKTHLVILRLKSDKWSAELFDISQKEVEGDNGEYVIAGKHLRKSVIPKSGWTNFLKHLETLDIFRVLYNQKIYENKGCGGADGMNYNFEIATPKKYRFFHHCYPEGKLLDFALYLEKEFGFEFTKE